VKDAAVETPPASPKPVQEKSLPKVSGNLQVGKELKVDSQHNAPRIISLDKLEEEIDNSEQNQTEQVSKLTSENLAKAWEDYIGQVQSPSVRNTLRNAELRIANKEIIALVGSQMAKGLIQDETELMPFVRQELNDKGLSLRVDIDPSKAPKDLKPKHKKLLGNREKFEKMRAINPLVDELRKRFDLLPDND